MMFHKAQRKKAKLRLAICGPSGSGKTLSALMIAKGIGGSIAMIDTESGSGELYADNPKLGLEYDVMQFSPPYSPQRAIDAIQAAQKAGYNVVIFDSLSHIWMGEGGMLEMVDNAAKGLQGNSFAAWKNVRPHEKKFLEALTRTDIHIIATMRTKTEWTTEKDKNGKTRPVKIGLKPEQREGLEYEFTVVFDMTIDGNIATAGKDRTDMFKDQYFTPSEETGRQLLRWLESGEDGPKFLDMAAIGFEVATANSVDALKSIFLNYQDQAKASNQHQELNAIVTKRKKELEEMDKKTAGRAKMSDGQRKAIMAHYSDWDRDRRIRDMESFLGREIKTFSDLFKDEAQSFLDAINADREKDTNAQ